MIESAPQLLLDAAVTRARLSQLPLGARPVTPEEGYQCQAHLIERLTGYHGGETIG